MSGLLSSPRRRRRVAWALALAASGGILAAVAFGMQNTPEFPKQHLVDAPAQVEPTPQIARLSADETADVLDLSTLFVRTAVAHHHLPAAYDLVGPELRGGMTRAEWATGDNPVVPFPAVGIVQWSLAYSYRNDVALDVALLAPRNSDTLGKTFRIELRRQAKAAPWRVVSWTPVGVSGPGNVRSIAKRQAEVAAAPESATLGAWWLAFPAGLISVVLVLPLLLWLRSWHATRKAERLYRDTRGITSEL